MSTGISEILSKFVILRTETTLASTLLLAYVYRSQVSGTTGFRNGSCKITELPCKFDERCCPLGKYICLINLINKTCADLFPGMSDSAIYDGCCMKNVTSTGIIKKVFDALPTFAKPSRANDQQSNSLYDSSAKLTLLTVVPIMIVITIAMMLAFGIKKSRKHFKIKADLEQKEKEVRQLRELNNQRMFVSVSESLESTTEDYEGNMSFSFVSQKDSENSVVSTRQERDRSRAPSVAQEDKEIISQV